MTTTASAQQLAFGALLKRYRQAAGMSQETLGGRVGYSASHICKLERATRRPAPAVCELLADALALTDAERRSLRSALDSTLITRSIPLIRHLAPSLPLINRTREQTYLRRFLSCFGPQVLLFAGQPGIGKTRLLQEAAEQGESSGWTVLLGACHLRGGHGPFAPVLGALESYIHTQPASQLRDDLNGCRWLVRLLPELVETAGVPVPSWELPPDQERRLMFTAVRRFLANVSGPSGTLLVLDDLQRINSDGADLLRALVSGPSDQPLRIVGAYQNTDQFLEDACGSLFADLARDRFVKRIILEPLDPEAAGMLLDALMAGVQPLADGNEWRESALHRSAGIPFYEVCLAEVARAGAPDHAASVNGVSWEITQTIRQRIAALLPRVHLILQIVAVVERAVPRSLLTLLATQLGCQETEVTQALDTACRARLLVADGDDGYVIEHDLIQDVVETDIEPARRALLHLLIAEAIEHGQFQVSPGIIAQHYVCAGEHEKALGYLREAGNKADAAHAYADAADFFRELATQLETLDRADEAAWAHEHLGIMLFRMEKYGQALMELELALDAYHRAGNYDGQGRAAAHIGWVHCSNGTPEEGITRLQRELLGTARLSAQGSAAINCALCQLFYLTGRYADELVAAERTIELATTMRDRPCRATAQVHRATALALLGRTVAGLRVLEDQAIPLARAAGDAWVLAQALDLAAEAHLMHGAFDQAMRCAERALDIVERWEDPRMTAFKLSRRGTVAFYRGDWRMACADTERAAAMIRESKATWWIPYILIERGAVCLSTGLREQAFSAFAEGIALAERNDDLHALRRAHGLLAESELLEGNAVAARTRLEALLDRPGQGESDVTRLLPLLAWAHLQLDDLHQAESLVASSIERATSAGLHLVLVDSLRIQALVALRQRNWQDAEDALEGALSLSRDMHYPYAEAKAQYVYGLLYRCKGKLEQERKRQQAARALLRQLGERLYATYVERALAELEQG